MRVLKSDFSLNPYFSQITKILIFFLLRIHAVNELEGSRDVSEKVYLGPTLAMFEQLTK